LFLLRTIVVVIVIIALFLYCIFKIYSSAASVYVIHSVFSSVQFRPWSWDSRPWSWSKVLCWYWAWSRCTLKSY